MINQETTTELLYDLLADPSKIKPLNQKAHIVSRHYDENDDNESFIIDYNNLNKNSPKISFNSDRKPKNNLEQIIEFNNSEDNKISEENKLSEKQLNDMPILFTPEEKINIKSTINFPEVIHHNFTQSSPIQQQQPSFQSFPKSSYQPSNIANQREIKFKKMEVFTKLMHIKNLGMSLTQHYTIESDLEEMELELKYQNDIQSKKNGVQLAKSFMCNAITGIEFLNEKYDPFGFKFNGWSNQVKTNKDDFDEVFTDLLEKYKGNGTKMEPELKLAMMLIISGASFHMSQTLVSNLPGLGEVIKNNPELMTKLQSNINKSISGPSELDKKKELYNNVKKLHEEKIKKSLPKQQSQKVINKALSTNNKTTSVKTLLNDIKKSVPFDNIADTYSITIGNTIDTETESSINKVSQGVKTKSRLANKKLSVNNINA
jgi:hypothetical protein